MLLIEAIVFAVFSRSQPISPTAFVISAVYYFYESCYDS
jgi:hypothetical protein